MRTNLKPARGFTLIELLVVLVVIGVLATLVILAVDHGAGVARRINCVNNVRQLGHALALFVNDNHVYPLALEPNPEVDSGPNPTQCVPWNLALERELGKISRAGEMSFISDGIWKCPAMRRPSSFPSNLVYESYGYNGFGLFGGESKGDANSLGLGMQSGISKGMTVASLKPVRETEVTHPSEMMGLADGFWGSGKALYGGGSQFTRTPEPLAYPLSLEPFSRHRGRANVAFCDGHVQSPTLQTLFEDTSETALSRWNRDHRPHREKL